MLRILRIRNFAIIDALALEFEPGFNVITGETGAGKSIILDALGLILGNRSQADLIRTGHDEATVEAVFDIGHNERVLKKLSEKGIATPDGELLIKRIIHRSGKGRIFLNDELTVMSQLADITENLVDLCSQHEHQSLIKSAYQLDLIDRYGNFLELRRSVKEIYSSLRSKQNELEQLINGSHDQEQVKDFLKFQINEIDCFPLKTEIDEELSNLRKKLLNTSQITELTIEANNILEGIHDDHSNVQNLLSKALKRLQKAAELDSSLEKMEQLLKAVLSQITEISTEIRSYTNSLEFDETLLHEIDEKYNQFQLLKKKYGNNVQEILNTRERLEQQLTEFESRQERVNRLQEIIEKLKQDFLREALNLTKQRKKAARLFQDSIQQELLDLGMQGTTCCIHITTASKDEESLWGSEGLDHIQFQFAPNPGEELKPLAKVASGGELSRILLAIRRVISDRGGIGVYLFDEIDAGIGGQTASIVGKKLKSVSQYNQVICISHLPQVAAFANCHFSVCKKVANKRTFSEITKLQPPQRIDEIARMLGGFNISETSRGHAKNLIKQAQH